MHVIKRLMVNDTPRQDLNFKLSFFIFVLVRHNVTFKLRMVHLCLPLELDLSTSELWSGQEQERILS